MSLRAQGFARNVVPPKGGGGDGNDGCAGREKRRRTSTRRAGHSSTRCAGRSSSRSCRVKACPQKHNLLSRTSAAPTKAEAGDDEVIVFPSRTVLEQPMTDASDENVENDNNQPPASINKKEAPLTHTSTAFIRVPRFVLPAPPGVAGPPEIQMQQHHVPTASPMASSPLRFVASTAFIQPRTGNTFGLITPAPSFAAIHASHGQITDATTTTTITTTCGATAAIVANDVITSPLEFITDAAQHVEAATTLMLLIPNLSE